MNTPQSAPIKAALLASLLTGAFISAASADIIYQDKFDRIGNLNGSAPTLDNTGSSATWTSSAGYLCTGTNGLVNNSIDNVYQAKAVLPLNWTTTYPDPRVQIDAQVGGTADKWLSLVLGDCDYWGYPSSTAMLKLYANGNVDVCHGPGWDGNFVITNIVGAGTSGGWNRLRIDYSNSVGTATFYVNGNVVAKDVPITSNTTGVGMDSDTGNNTFFTNLLVTFGNETISPASISSQPKAETIFVGDTLQLTVGTSGTLPLHYTWRKNGADIPGPNANTFTIPGAAVSDSANYSVVVTNSAGSVTSSIVRADVHLEADSPLAVDDFDLNQSPVAYNFTFTYSSDGTLTLPSTWTNDPTAGSGGSTGRVIHADGTDFVNGSVTFAGFGGGWGHDIRPLPTHNLNFYIADILLRVENLKSGVTNTPGRVALRFYAQDGTLGPTNGAQDLIFSVVKSYSFTSNFQQFTFILNSADFGGDAGQAMLNQYQTNIFRFQWELTCDNFYTDFANGSGDALIADNTRLLLRQSPALRVNYNGTQPVLSWDDPNVQLFGATNVAGPYILVSGATSAYPVPPASGLHYFRTSFTAVP